MNIQEIRDSLQKESGREYKSDVLTKQGYGQTRGAYYDVARRLNIDDQENPTQWWHCTVSYLGPKDGTRSPTFERLQCPELMIWIAEVTGLKDENVDSAIKLLKEYEKQMNSVGTRKGADFFDPIIDEIKEVLHMREINKILIKSASWDEAKREIQSI